MVKPNVPTVSTATVSPIQNVPSQSKLVDKNTPADEEAINQVMFDEVWKDVQVFQSQFEDVLKLSLKTSKLKVRILHI